MKTGFFYFHALVSSRIISNSRKKTLFSPFRYVFITMAHNLTSGMFFYFFGHFVTNEINERGVAPLGLRRGNDAPRPLTQVEQEDYDAMVRRGPKTFIGPIPTEQQANVRTVRPDRYLQVSFLIVTYNSGRIECFGLGCKFTSINQCRDFIERYNVAATQARVRNLMVGNRRRLARRIRGHKICLRAAFESYYNSRSIHGTSVQAFRRRGLTEKMAF